MVPWISMRRTAVLALLILSVLPDVADAQVFVVPRRPNKSRVRYFDFDWMQVDILAGELLAADTRSSSTAASDLAPRSPVATWGKAASSTSSIAGAVSATSSVAAVASATVADSPVALVRGLGSAASEKEGLREGGLRSRDAGLERSDALRRKAGGMRLYFYRQEDVIAGRAAGAIEATYREYAGSFQFVPRDMFPYVLYSSYQEFLQTNLFPVEEGVLGVTSTRDLKLALPYFGDYRLFREVSRHEMAHQFTIQKVREAAEDAETAFPLDRLPLWFVEGLAEFYAKERIDPEAEMLALDLVLNASLERGYGLLGFFEDRPFSGLWTYKIGQVRCVFLEETYGHGTIQRILEASPLLVSDVGNRTRIGDFAEFVGAVVGDEPRAIAAKFEAWIKARSLARYLRARHSAVDLVPLGDVSEIIDSLTASPSGNLLLFRTIDLNTGQASLILFDHRSLDEMRVIVTDGTPGYESLHPVAGRTFDLTDRALVFVTQDAGADVLYWQAFEHEAGMVDRGDKDPDSSPRDGPVPAWSVRLPPPLKREAWEVDFSFERRIKYDLGERGILAAYAPAFSPEGDRIAFIGLDTRGQRDVYVLEGAGQEDFEVIRLTNDEYAERELTWGPGGIVFTSDRTLHGAHNLFRVRPDKGALPIPLLDEPRDHQHPRVLPDGRVLFVSNEDGRANVFEVGDSGAVQRTDVSTGLFDIAPAPEAGIWALFHHGGARRIVRIARDKLLDDSRSQETGAPETTALAARLRVSERGEMRPRRSLDGAEPYRAWASENWQIDNVFAFAGVGGGSVFGRILAATSDRLRNHALIIDLAALGSFDLTDGHLIYVNEERRFTWGLGAFQSLQFRIDQTFGASVEQFFSAERFYGALGIVRYPLDRFIYLQADLSLGGVGVALSSDNEDFLRSLPPDASGRNLLDVWRSENVDQHFQTEASLRLGFDTIRYHRGTGPLAGSSILLEGTIDARPFDREIFGSARLDAEQYFQIVDRVNFFLRGGAGTTFGGKLARQFFLSSFDTLRGVEFGDQDFLLGEAFWFSTAELQLPLNAIVALAFLTDIEGVVGVDFGGVADEITRLWDRRILDFVLGVNFGLGPLVLRLHFAKPIDVGAPLPSADRKWVTNFSLGWIYF